MSRKGYKQTEEHKRKHLEKIHGANNGNYKHGKAIGLRKTWNNDYLRSLYTPLTKEEKKKYDLIHRLRNYGLTVEDYQKMIESQDSRCAICGLQSDNLFVDHCHSSGKVRGLLCRHCNFGLGFFRDDSEVLAKAIGYLRN